MAGLMRLAGLGIEDPHILQMLLILCNVGNFTRRIAGVETKDRPVVPIIL
jgi:hypothetical protein